MKDPSRDPYSLIARNDPKARLCANRNDARGKPKKLAFVVPMKMHEAATRVLQWQQFTAAIETSDAPTGVFVRANGFSDRADKDYLVDSAPYGEPTMGRLSVGGQLRYDQTWGDDWLLHTVSGTIEDRSHFVDVGLCVYNWLGQCVREGSIVGETHSTGAITVRIKQLSA